MQRSHARCGKGSKPSREYHVLEIGCGIDPPLTHISIGAAIIILSIDPSSLCGINPSLKAFILAEDSAHDSATKSKVTNVMSGRPSSTRGKRSGHGKRGGGGFDSGGRSGYSNRYSNEPPPRFKRNGDARSSGSSDGRGGYDHYEDRGSGSYSPHKGRQQGSNSSQRSNFGKYHTRDTCTKL